MPTECIKIKMDVFDPFEQKLQHVELYQGKFQYGGSDKLQCFKMTLIDYWPCFSLNAHIMSLSFQQKKNYKGSPPRARDITPALSQTCQNFCLEKMRKKVANHVYVKVASSYL